MWVGAETPLYQPSDGTHLSPQFCLVLITDEMGIACKVPNTVPGALPLPSDIFSCGHDSKRSLRVKKSVASTPVARVLPKAIAHQVVFEMGDG
jgi:hypothetical protein